MMVLDWKKLAINDAPGENVIAMSIPVEAPHCLEGLSPDLMRQIEILQLAVISNQLEEQINLCSDSLAILLEKNKVKDSFSSNKKEDFGVWLQKFTPWQSDYLLVVIDSKEQQVSARIPFRNFSDLFVCFRCVISVEVEKEGIPWGRTKKYLTAKDIEELIVEYLSQGEFSFFLSPEKLQNNRHIKSIEKKFFPKLAKVLKESGLLLHRWTLSLENVMEKKEERQRPTRRVDHIVEQMEGERLKEYLISSQNARKLDKQHQYPENLETKLPERRIDIGDDIVRPQIEPDKNNKKNKIDHDIEKLHYRRLKMVLEGHDDS